VAPRVAIEAEAMLDRGESEKNAKIAAKESVESYVSLLWLRHKEIRVRASNKR